jgi:hypothetical protein
MRRIDSKGVTIEKQEVGTLSKIPKLKLRRRRDGKIKPFANRERKLGSVIQMNTDVLRLSKGNVVYMANRHNKIARAASIAGVTSVSALARLCNVPVTACARWLEKHLDFRRAFEMGIDAKVIEVEAALARRAIGYDTTTVTKRTEVDRVTGQKRKVKEVRTIHVPGEVAAQKMFLENRRTKRWTKSRGVPTKSMNVEIKLDATDDGL